MNYAGSIISDIRSLLSLFIEHCEEKSTLSELVAVLQERNRWPEGHKLFQKIRSKLKKVESADTKLETQYLFEEICAKTIYNLSHSSAPFDSDSPYWIIPNALSLAKVLGLPESAIIDRVTNTRALAAELNQYSDQ